ncbi:MAG: DUF5686 and carboxypeptidase regulatory-like domain-containing protein [Bacteroidota bacterium]|jgi:hypothetical protein
MGLDFYYLMDFKDNQELISSASWFQRCTTFATSMLKAILFCWMSFVTYLGAATTIEGSVADADGRPLPYASIAVQGTNKGAVANSQGRFELNLPRGEYTLICQHVGYAQQKKRITVQDTKLQVNFILTPQELVMPDVLVKKGEDPAYAIIRSTIAQQQENLDRTREYSCQVYSKGQLRLRSFPKKFMGEKVDFEDGDTGKQKILYLSETVSRFSIGKKSQRKVEVISSKVSGNSDGYGLAVPDQYSLYQNNVLISTRLNPRGFVSPLASNAISFYRYKYLGTFYENQKAISRVQVTPRRNMEPLFSGVITIVEDEWQLYSVDLSITAQQQLELLDTLKLVQLYQPNDQGDRLIYSQVLYPAAKKFGFDAYGSFVNIYTEYNTRPSWTKRSFDRTILRYTEEANKKDDAYWESMRPVPLMSDELRDYIKKDSLERVQKDPRYIDSLNKIRNAFSVSKLLLRGQTLYAKGDVTRVSMNPVIEQINFNPAEGLVVQPELSWRRDLDSVGTRRSLSGSVAMRYGFANKRFSPRASVSYNFGSKLSRSLSVSFGRQVLQFNEESPIDERNNTLACLLYEQNVIKTYQSTYGRIRFASGIGAGLGVSASIQYASRSPLENRTDYTWRDLDNKSYSPNYPTEIATSNVVPHQVFQLTAGIRWQPGARYIELPQRTINVGGKSPIFALQFVKSMKGIAGSDGSFFKWKLDMTDQLNLKLRGIFRYRIGVGGFMERQQVFMPDFAHFNANNWPFGTSNLSSFMLLPAYQLSHTEPLYGLGHAEYNLIGFLTNKIPGIKKLNLYLLTGLNTAYVNADRRYFEWYVGIDNLFKVIRADYIFSYMPGRPVQSAFRIGITDRLIR